MDQIHGSRPAPCVSSGRASAQAPKWAQAPRGGINSAPLSVGFVSEWKIDGLSDSVLRRLKRDAVATLYPRTNDTFFLIALQIDDIDFIAERITMESVVAAIFHHHSNGQEFGARISGAEFWTGVRGELALHWAQTLWHRHCGTDTVAQYKTYGDHECKVPLPFRSTVTYLSDTGGPTLVVYVSYLSRQTLEKSEVQQAFFSYPVKSKVYWVCRQRTACYHVK